MKNKIIKSIIATLVVAIFVFGGNTTKASSDRIYITEESYVQDNPFTRYASETGNWYVTQANYDTLPTDIKEYIDSLRNPKSKASASANGSMSYAYTDTGSLIFMSATIMGSDGTILYCIESDKQFPSMSGYQIQQTIDNQGLWATMRKGAEIGANYAEIQTAVHTYLALANGDTSYVVNGGGTLTTIYTRTNTKVDTMVKYGLANNKIAEKTNVQVANATAVYDSTKDMNVVKNITVNGFSGSYSVSGLPSGAKIYITGTNTVISSNNIPNGTKVDIAVPKTTNVTKNITFTPDTATVSVGVYWTSNNTSIQDLAEYGYVDPVAPKNISLTYNAVPQFGNVTGTKLGRNADGTTSPLSGVSFNIHQNNVSGNVVATVTTNSSGLITSSDLNEGNYCIVETSTVKPYLKDNSCYPFTIAANQTTNLDNGSTAWSGGLVNERVKGQITLTKNEDPTSVGYINQLISGAEYGIYLNGNLVDTKTTDNNGKIEFSNLEVDTAYTIKETKAPAGYNLNPTVYTVNVAYNQSTPVVNVNQATTDTIIKGRVQLLKQDQDTLKYLEGAEFTIYDENGKLVETITTDTKGLATSSYLRYGTYSFKETKAPFGYKLNDTTYSFRITTEDQLFSLNHAIGNESYKAMIKAIKIDGTDSNITLQGAKFSILNENKEVIEFIEKGFIFNKKVSVFETDVNGQLIIPHYLTVGNYFLKEVEPPLGYLGLTDPIAFTISEDSNIAFEQIGDNVYFILDMGTVENFPITNEIQVSKVDATSQEELEGATMQLFNSNDELLEEWVSTKEAHIMTLFFGKYYIIETIAPIGHEKTETIFPIIIEEDGKVQKIVVENKAIIRDVEISKVDATNEDELEGAHMELYTCDDVLIDKWISTKQAHKVRLPYGCYYIKETIAPKTHKLLETTIPLIINENGEVLKVKVKNEPLELPSLPNTGVSGFAIGYISLLSGLTYLGYLREKRKNENKQKVD